MIDRFQFSSLLYPAMTMALDSASNERPAAPFPFNHCRHQWISLPKTCVTLLCIGSLLVVASKPSLADTVCKDIEFTVETINTLDEDHDSGDVGVTLIGHLPGRNYVVVVPGHREQTLLEIRRYVPDAFLSSSRLGAYIHAGAFDNRSTAETLSKQLRACKIRSRVVYFRNGRPV